MYVLIIFSFYLSVVAAPLAGSEVIPSKNYYAVPPTMAAAEFSTQIRCEEAAARTIAAMKVLAQPMVLSVGYTCNRKIT